MQGWRGHEHTPLRVALLLTAAPRRVCFVSAPGHGNPVSEVILPALQVRSGLSKAEANPVLGERDGRGQREEMRPERQGRGGAGASPGCGTGKRQTKQGQAPDQCVESPEGGWSWTTSKTARKGGGAGRS